MSLPEISRRCLSCGAAVRAGSRFCPQCGKLLEAEPAPPVEELVTPPGGEPSPVAQDWAPPTKEFAAFEEGLESGGPRAESDSSAAERTAGEGAVSPAGVEVETPAAHEPATPPEPERAGVDTFEADGADGAGIEADPAAASSVAAGGGRVARVREGTRARVERMREEAIVVLEETPDDSGLRFVVAAAALFVVFLVLLFLSTTVLR